MKTVIEMALEALEYVYEGANNQGPHTGISWRCASNKVEPVITALRQALANEALDKKAENARELGLDYEPAQQEVDWEKLYRLEVKKKEALAAKYERDTGKKLTRIIPMAEQPAQQEPVVLKHRLVKIHDALCNDLGDSDPYIDEDMTDEEICEEMPVFWAAKEIADLIGDAPWTQYTSPPAQRTWVGLTDGEISVRAANFYNPEMYKRAVSWAQEKLKERNQ